MTDSETILLHADDAGVRTLTLNRPHRKNALSPDLVVALLDAIAAADADESVRALVVTGAQEEGDPKAAFCAGGDLQGGMMGDGFLQMHEARGRFADLLRAIKNAATPTVAAVNGTALGGGFGLMLACDLVVCAKGAKLGTPEIKRGLFPMMIARTVYDAMPVHMANELVLLGENLDAERAAHLGIINRVTEAADVVSTAKSLAARLANLSPAVMRLGRRAVNHQRELSTDAALTFLQDQLTLNLQCEDAAEGITAFIERRDPEWKGR